MGNCINQCTAASVIQYYWRVYRAEKVFYEKNGVYPRQQSQENYSTLLQELKSCSELPKEERENIFQERGEEKGYLTSRERLLFKQLVRCNFSCQHLTHYYERIKSDGKLYSSKELSRRNIQVQTHTPSRAGGDDCVYFNFGICHDNFTPFSCYFLSDAPYAIMKSWSAPESKVRRIFANAWVQGHAHAYMCEQVFRSINLRETILRGRHHQEVSSEKEIIYYKTLEFTRPDGTVVTVKIRKESEIGYGRWIKLFNILQMIRFVRLAGPNFREYVLQKSKDTRVIGLLYNTLFHPGSSELLVPCSVPVVKGDMFGRPIPFPNYEVLGKWIFQGQYAKVEHIVEHENLDLNLGCFGDDNYAGLTPLALAVQEQKVSIVKLLIEHGADPDIPYFMRAQRRVFKQRPLEFAINAGNFSLVKVLLETNRSKDIKHKIHFTASVTEEDVAAAIEKRMLKKVFRYLFQKVFLNQKSLNRLLWLACYFDYNEGLEIILQAGANPNGCASGLEGYFFSLDYDSTLMSAFHLVVDSGQVEIVKLFLQRGVNCNVPVIRGARSHCVGKGDTPLLIAAKQLRAIVGGNLGKGPFMDKKRAQYLEIITLLIKHGADLHYINGQGESFIDLCISCPKIFAFLQKIETDLLITRSKTPTIDQQEAIEDPKILKRISAHFHFGVAIVKGVDQDGDEVILIGKSKDYSSVNCLTFPGGEFDGITDANLKETATFITMLQTGIALNRYRNSKEFGKLYFSYNNVMDNQHFLLHTFLFDLGTDIQNITLKSNDPATIIDDHNIFRKSSIPSPFTQAAFVKIKDCSFLGAPTTFGQLPLVMHKGERLSHLAGAVVALLCKGEKAYGSKLINWAGMMQLDGPNQLFKAIKTESYDEVKSLIQQGVKTVSPIWHPIMVASKEGCWKMLTYLLSLDIDPFGERINMWVEAFCLLETHNFPSEEAVIALFEKEDFYGILKKSNLEQLYLFLSKKGYRKTLKFISERYKSLIDRKMISSLSSTNYPLAETPIFISTIHANSEDDRKRTGDIDYANTLTKHLKQLGLDCTFIRGTTNEQKVFQQIKAHKKTEGSLLHVMINAPRTGFGFSINGLRNYIQSGGKVIVTAIEFAKHQKWIYKKQTLEYLKLAKQIIFLDQADKCDALRFAKEEKGSNQLLARLEQATVCPVPSTVKPCKIPPNQRSGNIISFGMLRHGKGHAHLIKLAQLIKQSPDPMIQKKKLYIVGTVQEHKTLSDGMKYDATLYRIMCALYPTKKEELSNKSPKELKGLLNKYESELVLKPALPIVIKLDVEGAQLNELFAQCTYSFLPAFRGATFRNSSMSVSVANQWITYSHIGNITPYLLRSGQLHGEAMVLIDSDRYETYADNVLEDIRKRERDKSLNEKTIAAAEKLVKEHLSIESITDKHVNVYTQVSE